MRGNKECYEHEDFLDDEKGLIRAKDCKGTEKLDDKILKNNYSISSGLLIFFISSFETCVYICVVCKFECPRSFWIFLISTPFSRRCVAKE
jgi:hypothetical protein